LRYNNSIGKEVYFCHFALFLMPQGNFCHSMSCFNESSPLMHNHPCHISENTSLQPKKKKIMIQIKNINICKVKLRGFIITGPNSSFLYLQGPFTYSSLHIFSSEKISSLLPNPRHNSISD